MNIGVPQETKIKEDRVACTPAGVRMLVQAGHRVCVQDGAVTCKDVADAHGLPYREATV